MIDGLPSSEIAWLEKFFGPPNQLAWQDIASGAISQNISDLLRPWLEIVAGQNTADQVVLPFVRDGQVAGWYAASRGHGNSADLAADLQAWFGQSYLSLFEPVSPPSNDQMAAALRERYGGAVYRFKGPRATEQSQIALGVRRMGELLRRKPTIAHLKMKPVGALRSDFERALLAQDPVQAQTRLDDLRATGRLNEENLQFLRVRMAAGLGYWPQLARDKWLITTLSDLHLPPQTLSDVIEALYRTYVDDVDATGEPIAALEAFAQDILKPYPRLFSSRRGVKTPRVVKAFLLYELSQAHPDRGILECLIALLPTADRCGGAYLAALQGIAQPEPSATLEQRAETAFDEAQYDRAAEFFLSLPLDRKVVTRLVQCAKFIDAEDTSLRVLAVIDTAAAAIITELSTHLLADIERLRTKATAGPTVQPSGVTNSASNGWMEWAEALATGQALDLRDAQVRDSSALWDVEPFTKSEASSKAFADKIGNLKGPAAQAIVQALPMILSGFFGPERPLERNTQPIASMLFDLLAMSDTISRVDLDLIAQLLARLLKLGPSPLEYGQWLRDLTDLENRVTGYGTLPWSLDVCEILATEPCPSIASRDARLGFFSLVLSHAQGFVHRLGRQDVLALEYLARDFGVDPESLSSLRIGEAGVATGSAIDLSGKTIGIYTLMEAAGARAKAILEAMFEGCRVIVNSDTVATAQLTNLAKIADIFIFAWKSSSHQAFFCVKDAPPKVEPVWAQGKGTASIVRAVLDQLGA